MIGHYRYASARMLISHKSDVFYREIEIISGLDNEKQQLERLKSCSAIHQRLIPKPGSGNVPHAGFGQYLP